MAAFVAGDVTYVLVKQRTLADSRKSNLVRLTFGAAAETYSTGGIPLTKAKMGMPVIVESLVVVDQGSSGYKFQYDQSTEKLIIMQTATATTAVHTHALHFNNADVTDGTTTTVNVGTNLMGANTGTDIAVAGVADTTGVGGIVQAAALTSAAAALTEVPNATDIATQVLECEVIGW